MTNNYNNKKNKKKRVGIKTVYIKGFYLIKLFLQVGNSEVQLQGAKEVFKSGPERHARKAHQLPAHIHTHSHEEDRSHVENPTIRSPLTNTMLSNFKTIQDTTTELITFTRVKLQRYRMCRLWLFIIKFQTLHIMRWHDLSK